MKYLSLFSGIAGADLAMQHLLGMECVGYVEWDDYCQRLIAQRQNDGFLDEAPIFGDIRAFLDSGYARSYTGLVDVITAGFPCQPHSTAGKRRGAADERDMWPATAEVIRMVRPQFVFLENVPGIIQGREPYVWRVISALSALGYDSRWCVLGARDVGAPHRRDRWWCLAHDNHNGQPRALPTELISRGIVGVDDIDKGIRGVQDAARRDIQAGAENSGGKDGGSGQLDNPAQLGCERSGEAWRGRAGFEDASQGIMGDGISEGQEGRDESTRGTNECPAWPPGPSERDRWAAVLRDFPELAPALSREEETECNVRRGIDGLSHRMDRLKALGNAQVALCAATAWRILNDHR